MNEFTIDILLEFLYKKFAITFALCLLGVIVRKKFSPKTSTDNKKNLAGEVIISAVFSTFLMCAVADYVNIDLHFEVYAIISIILGMWGLKIIKVLMDGKFIIQFIKNLTKTTNNAIIKNVVDSASDSILSYTDNIEDEKQNYLK